MIWMNVDASVVHGYWNISTILYSGVVANKYGPKDRQEKQEHTVHIQNKPSIAQVCERCWISDVVLVGKKHKSRHVGHTVYI